MYEQVTEGVVVRVEPRYLPDQSDPGEARFVWSYTVEIHNGSTDTLQLKSRHWRITDANGMTQNVQGAGVVGQQPVLGPGQRFSYTSAAPLSTPSGIMVGSYKMARRAGAPLDIAIPAFALDSPHQNQRAN